MGNKADVALLLLVVVAVLSAAVPAVAQQIQPDIAHVDDVTDDYETIDAVGGDLLKGLKHEVIKVELIGQNITGHVFRIPALKSYHLLPSLKGCPGRTNVSLNSEVNGCILATNAGFFEMTTVGNCLGHVVSDGKVVQISDSPRVAFGMTKTGKLAVGFVSAKTAESGLFTQLVQGAGWLLRNGEEYVDKAKDIEKIGEGFIALHAPRIALGYSKDGTMMIVETDGIETTKWGLDLHTFAKLIKSLGGYNMANVDGGGSVTIVWQKRACTAAGVGYDPCEGPVTRATINGGVEEPYQRPVTTITCFK